MSGSGAAVRLADVVAVLNGLYDPGWALDWDATGLVTGDLDQEVRRVLLAVDPVQAVIDEAIMWDADLLVTHHPLLLRGVHEVAQTGPKGRAVTSLVRAEVALLVAHTNADVAAPGVSDALADALGLTDVRPLEPRTDDATGACGLGRVGTWAATATGSTLRDFAAHVAASLPSTPQGVRVGGDLDAVVREVAVCGGAGDDLFAEVRASAADAYVTADLRHHPASEALEHGTPGLVDVSHWASEWPWLAACEALLRQRLGDRAATVTTRVSALVTDPFTLHC